jgi:hypothetical protein
MYNPLSAGPTYDELNVKMKYLPNIVKRDKITK